MNIDGKVVIITGAAGNLGKKVAEAFGQSGARLALVDVSAERLDQVYGPESETVLPLPVNLLDSAAVAAATEQVIDRYGRIDCLCNIAGGFDMGTAVHETPDDMFQRMYDLNVRTMVNMSRSVVPAMIEGGGGTIVTIGAGAALKGMANMGAYIASKSAVIRLSESMSEELKGKGINVNCVLPSIIDTPQNRAAMPKSDPGKWVTPEALADVVLFLSSGAARAIHGVALPVSGLS
ncbi:MAG: SDR family NAD(P)-dependent oxidoreductase [Rhodospirillales bacterium]